MSARIYLAGPDVFLPDPASRGVALKAICTRHGLTGVFPMDPLGDEPAAWKHLADWERIALRNEAHIRGCDALVANLTPFRGPSADAGTVFELGFMRALGRPVFGWSNTAVPFAERTRAALGILNGHDPDGLAVEAFGCTDNLMIDGAVRASGGALTLVEDAERRWTALDAFEACIARCASALAACVGGASRSTGMRDAAHR